MNKAPPSVEEQIEFLKKIQSLFEDSFFQATYKYALLITLTDLAVELGDENGNELFLDKKIIATRFAELYWRQVQPFPSGVSGCQAGILFHSDKSEHVKIIKDLLILFKESKSSDYLTAQKNAHWQKTLSQVISTVWKFPVLHLQDDTNQFLYEFPTQRNGLILKSGVAYCLRKFSEYIIQYSKSGWIEHIKKTKKNHLILGVDNDLESFLFGSSRKQLSSAREILIEHQSGKCFYCNKSASHDSDIDHFIPWKKYQRNLAQNLVLSCPNCNRSKSDMLASKIHMHNWLDKILLDNQRSTDINGVGFISDPDCAFRVSLWAYKNGVDSKSLSWESSKTRSLIDLSYIETLENFKQHLPKLLDN